MVDFQRHVRVLLDTGPIVAILNRNDAQHARCVETLKRIQPPLLTTWPVLTEAAWLLRNDPSAISKLFHGVATGLFRILEIHEDELHEIDKLSKRYATLSPQLADLSLVHLARREELETIFTLDHRDFTVFRRKGKTGFHLLPEE